MKLLTLLLSSVAGAELCVLSIQLTECLLIEHGVFTCLCRWNTVDFLQTVLLAALAQSACLSDGWRVCTVLTILGWLLLFTSAHELSLGTEMSALMPSSMGPPFLPNVYYSA